MKTTTFFILLIAAVSVTIWGCEKEALTSIDSDQQLSLRDPGNGNGKPGGGNEQSPCKGKTLGPWGIPDGLLHVYGTGPSEAAAQDFPCDFTKARKVTSIWARLARTGIPTDAYFVTLRPALDATILARSVDVPVADVISEDEIFESGEWVEFPLQSPYLMEPGDYFVQMERTGPGDYQNYINWFTDWQNPLPDHAGWVRSDEGEWIMYDEVLSDEFLIMLCYK